MAGYIIKRILYGVSILFGVVTLIFILFNVIPGDPARMLLGQRADSASVAAVRKDLGLDKPVMVQYVKYLNDLSPLSVFNYSNPGSFFYYDQKIYSSSFIITKIGRSKCIVLKTPYLRRSYQNQRNISEIIANAFMPTLLLALVSILFASILGILLGVISAIYKDTFYDRFMIFISSIGMSLPSFFAAILIAWLFAYVLGNYTGLNLTGSLYEIDDSGTGSHLALKNIILPAFTLGIRPLAVVAQLMRNTLLEVMTNDYIRTAYAKGLSKKLVIWRHALKNSLNPVITSISGWFASMMAGVIFIEYIFGWKGLGFVMVNALTNFDVPLVMSSVLVISIIFIVVNILTDITYSIIDPRVRLK